MNSFTSFKEENKEFLSMLVVDASGSITDGENVHNIPQASLTSILNAWNNHESSLTIEISGENPRYVVLKSDPLQLACVKPGSGKGIVGTSRNDKFAIAFLDNCENINASSVYFQKWIIDFL